MANQKTNRKISQIIREAMARKMPRKPTGGDMLKAAQRRAKK